MAGAGLLNAAQPCRRLNVACRKSLIRSTCSAFVFLLCCNICFYERGKASGVWATHAHEQTRTHSHKQVKIPTLRGFISKRAFFADYSSSLLWRAKPCRGCLLPLRLSGGTASLIIEGHLKWIADDSVTIHICRNIPLGSALCYRSLFLLSIHKHV